MRKHVRGTSPVLDEKPSPRSVTAPKTHLDGLKETEFGDWVILLMEENSAPVDMVNLYVNIKYPIIFRVLYMPGGCFGISSINSMMCSNSLRMNRKFTLKFHPLGLLKFRLVIFWEGKFGGDEGLVMEKHLKKRYSCCEGHFPHFKVLQAGEIQDFTKVILSVI